MVRKVSRSVQRRLEALGRRRLTVGYGEQREASLDSYMLQ